MALLDLDVDSYEEKLRMNAMWPASDIQNLENDSSLNSSTTTTEHELGNGTSNFGFDEELFLDNGATWGLENIFQDFPPYELQRASPFPKIKEEPASPSHFSDHEMQFNNNEEESGMKGAKSSRSQEEKSVVVNVHVNKMISNSCSTTKYGRKTSTGGRRRGRKISYEANSLLNLPSVKPRRPAPLYTLTDEDCRASPHLLKKVIRARNTKKFHEKQKAIIRTLKDVVRKIVPKCKESREMLMRDPELRQKVSEILPELRF